MPEGFLFAGEWKAPLRLSRRGAFELAMRKRFAEKGDCNRRRLAVGEREAAALGRSLGADQRVMVPSAVWACARRGWQRSKNRATCWGQRPM